MNIHRFIHSIILRNSVNAALQRARVYNDDPPQAIRARFKNSAKEWLARFADGYRRDQATEETWQRAITDLIQHLSVEFGIYLTNGHITIGVAQKMISLYLKFLWLITGDDAKKPLFAVVDRSIMNKANIQNMVNWTELDDMHTYMQTVRAIDAFARRQNLPTQQYVDGASWECDAWQEADLDAD